MELLVAFAGAAALRIRNLALAIAPTAGSVAEAMGRVNRELARDNERAMFVTAFAARLDLATGELEYVNAGHNPTYRLEPGRAPAPLGGPVDPALGAVEGHEYRGSVVRSSCCGCWGWRVGSGERRSPISAFNSCAATSSDRSTSNSTCSQARSR
jgi:hypothetical protein